MGMPYYAAKPQMSSMTMNVTMTMLRLLYLYVVNRKIVIVIVIVKKRMAFFLYGNLGRKIAISYISYSCQLNLVAPPNKILGLQEETRKKIKQEKAKVLVYLFVQIIRYVY